MNVSMALYKHAQDVEKMANNLGFQFDYRSNRFSRDEFSLIVDDETIPLYNEGAEMFRGSLSDVESFLIGINWARQYDTLLGLQTTKRREKIEQRIRNKKLLSILKNAGDQNGKKENLPF